jgi:hypothetical protein
MNDHKLVKWLLLVLFIPIGMSMCSGDRFRYPCQNPKNWDEDYCKMPICEVTRTCPEHIFKGQRDPRLPQQTTPTTPATTPAPTGACK